MTIALIIFAMILYIEASAITFISLYHGSKTVDEMNEIYKNIIIIIGTVVSPLTLPVIIFAGFAAWKSGDLG